MPHTIAVAREFSETPGPRFRVQGKFSGEEFLETLLRPRFEQVLQDSNPEAKLTIDLDGAAGYPTSFLEQAFGSLASIYSAELVLARLVLVSQSDPYLKDEIEGYIRDAARTRASSQP